MNQKHIETLTRILHNAEGIELFARYPSDAAKISKDIIEPLSALLYDLQQELEAEASEKHAQGFEAMQGDSDA